MYGYRIFNIPPVYFMEDRRGEVFNGGQPFYKTAPHKKKRK